MAKHSQLLYGTGGKMNFFNTPSLIIFASIICVGVGDDFRLLVISDVASPEQDNFSRIINVSTEFISLNQPQPFIFQPLNLRGESVEKSYTEVCNAVADYGANFIISLARNRVVQAAVQRVTKISTIPTIQVDYNPWYSDRAIINGTLSSGTNESVSTVVSKSESNYFSVLPPVITILNSLPDFIDALNITSLFILHDETFKLDMTTRKMLYSLPVNLKSAPITTNDTDIRDQIKELKARGVRNVLLMVSSVHAEKFLAQAQKEMEGKYTQMSFILLSKDIRPFQCDSCITMNLLWIRPDNAGNDKFPKLKKMKEYLLSEQVAMPDFINTENELDASFLLDLTNFAWESIGYLNATMEIYPIYGCYNGSLDKPNKTISLQEVYYESTGFGGNYGQYIDNIYQPSKFLLDMGMKVVRVLYNKATHILKNVATWNITEGILLEDQVPSLVWDVTTLKHYKVAIVVQPPFIEMVTLENGTKYPRGYCIDLINKIAENVKFTYTLHEVKDKSYGAISDTGEWNGLIRELISGSADIALAPLSVMAERENVVDFTVPYYDLVGTTILMKKPEVDYSLFKFMTVLEPPVWGCIVGAYFFTSFLLWIFDRFSPYSYTNNKEKYKDDPEKREFTLKECLWFCMTSLTPQGGGEAPKNISGRLVAATWWLFGFIIIASYTANLAAFLTVSRLETPISSLDDLAKQYKIKYAPVKGTASEVYFKRMAEIEDKFYDIWKTMSLNESMSPQERAKLAVWDYPVSDKFTNMYRYMQEAGFPNSTEDAIAKVKLSPNANEGFAFIGDATEIKYAELTDCSLQQVGTEFSRKPYAIAVQQGNDLKDKISSAILKLLNQRDLEHLKETWWARNPNKKNCPKAEDESDGISIQNIGGVFIVILVGIVLSLVTLVFEYWYYKDRRPPSDTHDNTISVTKEVKEGTIVFGNHLSNNNNNNNNISMGHFNSAADIKE